MSVVGARIPGTARGQPVICGDRRVFAWRGRSESDGRPTELGACVTLNVDEHLLNALGLQPAQGRLFARGETDRSDPAAAAATGRHSLARVVAIRIWRAADHRENGGSEQPASRSDRHHAAWRRCLGYPARDLVAAGVDPVQSRESPRVTRLHVIGRLKDDVTPEAAQTELRTLNEQWGERVGVTDHMFAADAGRCRGADVESRRRSCSATAAAPRSDRRRCQPGDLDASERPPDWCC